MLLSVIILCCNKDIQYLENCINSVIRCIQFSEYEIIVVNNSSTKLNIYDVNVINNKENLYPFESRRIGLDNSNGKYVWFVDCDDIAINKLYKKDLECNYDIIQFDFETEPKKGLVFNKEREWDNKSNIIKSFFYSLSSRFFKRDFLIELLKPIKRPIIVMKYDNTFIMEYSLENTNNIGFLKTTLYHYNSYLAGKWIEPLQQNEDLEYLSTFLKGENYGKSYFFYRRKRS